MNFKILSYFTFGLSAVLSILLLFFPNVIFFIFGLEGNATADFISRRAAMLFLGYAVIAFFSRNSPPSDSRQAITLGIALSMLGLAILGLFEFARGFAGLGSLLPICTEFLLSLAYFSVWRQEASRKASFG